MQQHPLQRHNTASATDECPDAVAAVNDTQSDLADHNPAALMPSYTILCNAIGGAAAKSDSTETICCELQNCQ